MKLNKDSEDSDIDVEIERAICRISRRPSRINERSGLKSLDISPQGILQMLVLLSLLQ